jgi:hypothetical protein
MKTAAEMASALKDIKDYIDYNPDTGKFYWKIKPNNRTPAGVEAGCIQRLPNQTPQKIITFKKVHYTASRIAWFYMTGSWPEFQLTFKNGNSLDLIWDNIIKYAGTEKAFEDKKAIRPRSRTSHDKRNIPMNDWFFS